MWFDKKLKQKHMYTVYEYKHSHESLQVHIILIIIILIIKRRPMLPGYNTGPHFGLVCII